MAAKANANSFKSMSVEELTRSFSKISSHKSSGLSLLLQKAGSRLARFIGFRSSSSHSGTYHPRFNLAEAYKIRLALWIFQNRTMFEDEKRAGCCYGKTDDACVYVTNEAFKLFCKSYQYNPTDVLRVLSDAACVVTRIGSFHGGYYKTSRICGEVKSCVWLIKDDFYNKLEACFYE